MFRRINLSIAILGGSVMLASTASAQTVTGTIDATITLTAACEVNGATGTTGVDFGALDFGSNTTLFSEATSQVNGNGSGAVSVQCTPGNDATLTFGAGQHDGSATGGTRAMSDGTQFVPYDIYSDAGYATALTSGETMSITADGTVQTVQVYGKAVGGTGLAAGTYTDTIAVTLTF